MIRINERLNGFICISKTTIPRALGIFWTDKLLHKGRKDLNDTSDRQCSGQWGRHCPDLPLPGAQSGLLGGHLLQKAAVRSPVHLGKHQQVARTLKVSILLPCLEGLRSSHRDSPLSGGSPLCIL